MTTRIATAGTTLTLLAILACATPALADHDQRRADLWIKYDDLPRRARQTVDRERRGHDVKQILEMRRDGKTYFRALIDERGADRAIFVSEGGRVLNAADVPDVAVGTGSAEQWIKYNDLPEKVRKTLDRERDRHEVKQICFVRRDNREFYRCIIDTRGDDLAIRINANGKLLSADEVNDVAVGQREIRRYDYNRERWVKYDDVPKAVRRSLDRERNGREIKQIVAVDRNGRQYYRAIIDDRRGDRILNVSEDGYVYGEREIREVSVAPVR